MKNKEQIIKIVLIIAFFTFAFMFYSAKTKMDLLYKELGYEEATEDSNSVIKEKEFYTIQEAKELSEKLKEEGCLNYFDGCNNVSCKGGINKPICNEPVRGCPNNKYQKPYCNDLYYKELEENNKEYELIEYGGGGHNISSPYFEQAINNTIEFYNKYK